MSSVRSSLKLPAHCVHQAWVHGPVLDGQYLPRLVCSPSTAQPLMGPSHSGPPRPSLAQTPPQTPPPPPNNPPIHPPPNPPNLPVTRALLASLPARALYVPAGPG